MIAIPSGEKLRPSARPQRRVLVAEDSSITQDLLKLLLEQRGYQVDTVNDGRQALEALRNTAYDVALLDFHMPQMNGLEVASSIRSEAKGRKLPRIVAITADAEGLLAHGADCENFDHVIPKPLDIYEVGKVVEEQAEIGDRQPPEAERARAPRLEMVTAETPAYPQLPGHEVLVWPNDLEHSRLSRRAMQATLGDPRFDGIVISIPPTLDQRASIWGHKALHLLPVIDMTGTLGAAADFDGAGSRDKSPLDALMGRFRDQRAKLHRDLIFTDNPGEKLLGRAFVSEKPIHATYDPLVPTLIRYNTIAPAVMVAVEGETLCAEGFLKRAFFDRFHVCQRCDSARMNVREECSKCRSANLVDESYLHHFRCAYQGPESEFRRGDDLVCPKCRRELANFGADYDRPGAMSVCLECRHASSEPAIGFSCLDCGAHADSATAQTRDAFTYEVTEQGIAFAEKGNAFLGQARRAMRFTDLPLELVIALNSAAKTFNESRIPFTLANIFYQNQQEVTADHGARQFADARDLFIDNLRAELGASDVIVRGNSYDFALIAGMSPELSAQVFDRWQKLAQSTLRYDLGATFKAFGPADFS